MTFRVLLLFFALIPAAFADGPCDPAQPRVPKVVLPFESELISMMRGELIAREIRRSREVQSTAPLLAGQGPVPAPRVLERVFTEGVTVRKVGNEHIVEIDPARNSLRLPRTSLRGGDNEGVYSGEAHIADRIRVRGSLTPGGRTLIVQTNEYEVWKIELPRGVNAQALVGHSIRLAGPAAVAAGALSTFGPEVGLGLSTGGSDRLPMTFTLTGGTDIAAQRGAPPAVTPAVAARLGFDF